MSISEEKPMRKLQRRWSMAVVVMGTMAGAAAFAQQQAQPQRAPAGRAAQPAGQPASKLDEHVAACLALENDNEIAAAKIAEQNARSDDVKDFAKTMVKDHQQFVSELEKFAGAELRSRGQRADNRTGAAPRSGNENRTANADREPRRDGRAPAANNAATAAPRANTAGQRANQDPYAQMLAIKEEIADECR